MCGVQCRIWRDTVCCKYEVGKGQTATWTMWSCARAGTKGGNHTPSGSTSNRTYISWEGVRLYENGKKSSVSKGGRGGPPHNRKNYCPPHNRLPPFSVPPFAPLPVPSFRAAPFSHWKPSLISALFSEP